MNDIKKIFISILIVLSIWFLWFFSFNKYLHKSNNLIEKSSEEIKSIEEIEKIENTLDWGKRLRYCEKKNYPSPSIPLSEKEKNKISTSEFIIYLNKRIDPDIADLISNAVDKYCEEYNLPVKLILGIINRESHFDHLAKSSVAFGLMQVYPKFHPEKCEEFGINIEDNNSLKNLYHIEPNIAIGCKIFKEYYLKSEGDLKETFHNYLSKKASENKVRSYMNDILYTCVSLEMYERDKLKEKIEIEKNWPGR